MASSTLFPHAAFFVDHAPSPDIASLAERGPLLAFAAGIAIALATWVVASMCADPRRDRCAIRWLSEVVSGTLSTLTTVAPVLARLALGSALVWCAVIGAVATPNLRSGDGTTANVLELTAVVLGAALVIGFRARTAAVGAIATFVAAAFAAGTPVVVLERLDIVGLAVFVAVVGGSRLDPRMDAATLARLQVGSVWLRMLLGIGLLVVAVTEKLANVPMTATVLDAHPNVDVGLLLGTDPQTTVLLLGTVEVAFALLVMLLPLPELLALAIGAPFVLSVGEFGVLEVPGHLPVWGAVAVLALLGAHVQTADLVTIRPPWMRHVRRTPDAARERIVGATVPWLVVEPVVEARRIIVGGTATTPPATVSQAFPPIAPQVAAWIDPAARQSQTTGAAIDAPRFSWAPHPGAGAQVR